MRFVGFVFSCFIFFVWVVFAVWNLRFLGDLRVLDAVFLESNILFFLVIRWLLYLTEYVGNWGEFHLLGVFVVYAYA